MKLAIPQLLGLITSPRDDSGDPVSNEEEISRKNTDGYLQGKDMVLLHQYLSVLRVILENSSVAKQFCINNYNEELR